MLNFDGKKSNFTGKYGGGFVCFRNGVLLKASFANKICHLCSREACQDKLSTTETVCWGRARRQPERTTPFKPSLSVGFTSSRSSTIRLELSEQLVDELSITRCGIREQRCPANHSDVPITHRADMVRLQIRQCIIIIIIIIIIIFFY